MKKGLKQLIITVLLVLSMVTSVFATTPATGSSITISSVDSGASIIGHTFSVYKVFDLTYAGENFAYGLDGAFVEFFKGKAPAGVDQDNAFALNEFAVQYVEDQVANMNVFAKELRDYVEIGRAHV